MSKIVYIPYFKDQKKKKKLWQKIVSYHSFQGVQWDQVEGCKYQDRPFCYRACPC